ncbi:hypothetical protein Ae201684P_008052 [Aphanomyces euteiches]|nr:hypothetical protein Ae201684P_008052 [Aphanomyces euteiches]
MVWCPREDQVKSPSGSKKYGGPSGTQALDRPSCLMTARHGHAELKPPRSKNTSVVAVRVQCLLFFAFAKQMLAYFGFLAQFEPISNTSTLSIGYLFVFLWRHIDYLAFFDPIFVQARRGGFALYISTEQREYFFAPNYQATKAATLLPNQHWGNQTQLVLYSNENQL